MKKRSLNKNIFREIIETKGRFLSILAMVTIGVMVFVGLKSTGPAMVDYGLNFIKEHHINDISINSTYGIDKDDVKEIEKLDGIKELDLGYSIDLPTKDGNDVVRIDSLSPKIDTIQVTQGHLPQNNNEILLDKDLEKKGYKIGDKVSFNKERVFLEGEKNKLKSYEFNVVGFGISPDFLNILSKGVSSEGDGKVTGFGIIKKEDFSMENFSNARIILEPMEGIAYDTKQYKAKIDTYKDKMEQLLASRPKDKINAMKKELTDKLNDGQAKVDDAKKKIADAQKKLDDAQKEINDGYKKYNDGKKTLEEKISKGRNTLALNERELVSAKSKLDSGKKELESKQKEYDNGLSEYNQGLKKYNDGITQVNNGLKQLDQAEKDIISKLEQGLKKAKESQSDLKLKLKQVESNLEKIPEAKQQLPDVIKERDALQVQRNDLVSGIESIEDNIQNIDGDINLVEEKLKDNPSDEALIEKLKQLKSKKSELGGKIVELKSQITKIDGGLDKLNGTITSLDRLIKSESALISNREQLLAGILETEKSIEKINQGLEGKDPDIEKAKSEIVKKRVELLTAKTEIEKSKPGLDEAKKKLDDGLFQLNQGKAKIASNQKLYDSGIAKIIQGKKDLEKAKKDGEQKLADSLKKLNDGQKELSENRTKFNTEKTKADKDIKAGEKDLKDGTDALRILKKPRYNVVSRSDKKELHGFFDTSKRLDIVSNIFPVFFFAIAMLVSLTTMTRMVEEHRLQMGTLKALGYDNKDIIKKYVIYGGTASVIGGIIGNIIGHKILGLIIARAYSSDYVFLINDIPINYKYAGFAFIIGLISTVVSSMLVAKKSLYTDPAQLMRGKAPTQGTRIMLERIPFIWNHLSFLLKVTMRNIFRYKRRMFMTVIGVAGCTGLLFMGFGIKDSISGLVNKQFGEIFNYRVISVFDKDFGDREYAKYNELINDKSKVKEALSANVSEITVPNPNGLDQQVNLVVPSDANKFYDFVKLQERVGKKPLALGEGVIITEKLSTIYKLKTGDTLEIKDEDNKRYKVKIIGITENYAGHYMYMDSRYYKDIFKKEYSPNSNLLMFQDNGKGKNEAFLKELLANKTVVSVINLDRFTNSMETILDSINVVVLVIVLCSSILAFVVLYNLTNINISERIREISTIKVLGFYSQEVTAYVFRETVFLTLLGIFVGYGIGYFMHYLILSALIPDVAMLDPAIQWTNYLISALITMIFTGLVFIIINRKLKKIDMVEALKSIE